MPPGVGGIDQSAIRPEGGGQQAEEEVKTVAERGVEGWMGGRTLSWKGGSLEARQTEVVPLEMSLLLGLDTLSKARHSGRRFKPIRGNKKSHGTLSRFCQNCRAERHGCRGDGGKRGGGARCGIRSCGSAGGCAHCTCQ